MFYRYELWVEGEPQAVGFLIGLDDIGLTDMEVSTLLAPFDERLPIPPSHIFSQYRTRSWFTEYGVDHMQDAIDAVISAYEENSDFWEVVCLEQACLDEEIVYEDDYQVIVTIN